MDPSSWALGDTAQAVWKTKQKLDLGIFLISLAWITILILHLVLKSTNAPVRLALVLLIGWCCGKVSQNVLEVDASVDNSVIPETVTAFLIPPIFFFKTLKVDYHTFSRSMGQILGVAVPAFIFHCLLVSLVTLPVLSIRNNWDWRTTLSFVCLLSSVQVNSTILELKKVYGQLRQLHLLLQGEKVISVCLMTMGMPLMFRYFNPHNERHTNFAPNLFAYFGWLLVCMIPAFLSGLAYRYLLNVAYNDIICQAVLALASIYFTAWFGSFLGGAGSLSVVCFGITVGCSKVKYSSEAEKFFDLFWDMMEFYYSNAVYFLTGLLIGMSGRQTNVLDLGIIMVCFGLMMIARTLSLAMSGLVHITRSGWIAWKHYIVALWGVYKGTPHLVITCHVFLNYHYEFSDGLILYVTGIVLLSTFVNVVGLSNLLRALGMYDLTSSRILNMDGAVNHVNHCREKAIMQLKMDRVIADANWLVVDQTTKLTHPYSRLMAVAEDESNEQTVQARVITCADCGAESVAPLTKKELIDLTLEAKHRILKAQMMSFWKQSENGTVTSHGYRFLVNVVEMASVRDDPILSQKDLKIQREGSPCLRRLKAFFGFLYTITSTTHRFIPTFWLRALCFRICTSRTFQILMACICLIDLATLANYLLAYYMNYPTRHSSPVSPTLQLYQMFDFVFFSIFFIEFVMLLLGIGVVQYFQANVNKIEFATGIIIRPTELAMVLDSDFRLNIENVLLFDTAIVITKTLLLLRFARIYIFIVALIPRLLNLVDRKMDDDLIKAYDVGKAYVISLDKVIKFLGYIVDNELVFNQLVDYMENERRSVTKELGLIQKDRPTIAITIKTRHAVRHVINTMNECVTDMKEEGMLDWTEQTTLRNTLLRVKKKTRSLVLISPSYPDHIIREVPWLFGDSQTSNFFSDHAMLSSFSRDDIIIHYGDDPFGLYFLVSGLVHSYYKPSENTTFMAKTYGVLPNYDFFINHNKIEMAQEEYIVGGGNLIGELGVLTNRRYDMVVVCETSVQLFYIPVTIANAVIHDSSNGPIIRARMWKAVAMKIGVNLLPYTARFQGWSREKLLLYLQRGVVPVLEGVTMMNINSEVVDDVFLIEGVAMDMATRSVFVAPVMIPRTIQKLLFPDSYMWDFLTVYPTHLLVIPASNSYVEDIMGPEGIFKGNYQDQDAAEGENDEEDDEDEDDDEENEEEEEEGPKESEGGAQTCKDHARKKITADLLLKLRRRRNKRIAFLEYVPTLSGPVEGNIATTTFVIKTERGREIRTNPSTRRVEHKGIPYTQDIEEVSEIGSVKDLGFDSLSVTSTKRPGKSKKSISAAFARPLSSDYSLVGPYRRPSDQPERMEILVIDSDSDLDDAMNSKTIQTSLIQQSKNKQPMRPARRSTIHRFSLRPNEDFPSDNGIDLDRSSSF